ncbi:MAG: DNA recombination protein RmuC [Gaiellaceae bacterium]
MVVAALILGLALGALVAWLALRGRSTRLELELGHEQRAHAEKLETLVRAREELADAFQAMSAEALRQNNTSFLQLARTQLEGFQTRAREDMSARQQAVEKLVAPIRESLEKVDKQANELEQARRQAYGSLTQQLTTLSERTGNLVTALRTPHMRGRWGEVQLKRVVELAGMVEHCDFDLQTSATGDDGQALRPDLVVRLPGGRCVVVDAKVPLDAYLQGVEASDEETRAARAADHARQVREHVLKLGAKSYGRHVDGAPEFVLMFIPLESLFGAACAQDPELLEFAAKHRVMLASPMMLIATLQLMAHSWQQETIAVSAREVHKLGEALYDRLGTLGKHFAKLGRSLDGAVGAYNDAVGSIETRVLVAARKFEQHGIAGELPELEPIERQPRPLQALELAVDSGDPRLEMAPPAA